jgi:hypothetical protein
MKLNMNSEKRAEDEHGVGTQVAISSNTNPRLSGVFEADDGTRTHDLLHGKRVVGPGPMHVWHAWLSRFPAQRRPR